jgi:signal transduction histidine kinase
MEINLDITAAKQAEEQLRQSQKMEALGTLAGGIAHDFNNILAAIIGFSEMARDETPEGSPARRHMDRVFSAGIRGRDLVQQILISAGRLNRRNGRYGSAWSSGRHLFSSGHRFLLRSVSVRTYRANQGLCSPT